MTRQTIILGAGVSGLGAGYSSGYPIYEAKAEPGGLCSSYYMHPSGSQRLDSVPADAEVYRFEIGGGHWLWGGDPFGRAARPICDGMDLEATNANGRCGT